MNFYDVRFFTYFYEQVEYDLSKGGSARKKPNEETEYVKTTYDEYASYICMHESNFLCWYSSRN